MKSIEVSSFSASKSLMRVKESQQPWPRRGYHFICIHSFLSVDENVARPFLIMPPSLRVSCKTRATPAPTLDETRYLAAELSQSYRGVKRKKCKSRFGYTPTHTHREGTALRVQPFTNPMKSQSKCTHNGLSLPIIVPFITIILCTNDLRPGNASFALSRRITAMRKKYGRTRIVLGILNDLLKHAVLDTRLIWCP